MNEVEKVWEEFWKPIIAPDGEVNMDQVKRELYDFHVVMQEVSKAYDHITGGRISKVNTDHRHVIEFTEEHYNDNRR